MLWLQLMAVLPLAAAGIAAGRLIGHSRRWLLGFLLPMLVIVLVILGHRSARLALVAPISWAADIDIEPPLMALAIPLVFSTLQMRLPRPRRLFMALVAAIFLIPFSIMPALCPLLARPALRVTRTQFDRHGVCLQSLPYTCGPAAAVTCLIQLGLPAEEGELALAARCGPFVGTDAQFLAATLTRRYAASGMRVECCYFDSLDYVPTPAIAEAKMPRIGGHYVALLSVEGDEVIVGDPLTGLYRCTRAQFLAAWKHTAIVFLECPPTLPASLLASAGTLAPEIR